MARKLRIQYPKWGQASTLRIPPHIPRVRCAGSPHALRLVAMGGRTLALLGVPKWRRVAICLTESVVSLRWRAVISSLAGSCLRRDARPAGCQPKRTSSSLTIRRLGVASQIEVVMAEVPQPRSCGELPD